MSKITYLIAILCLFAACKDKGLQTGTSSNHSSRSTPVTTTVAAPRPVDPTERYKSVIVGTWKLDSLRVGDFSIPAKVIEFESTLQFTKEGKMIATSGTYKAMSLYNIIGNKIFTTPLEKTGQALEMLIEQLTATSLVLQMQSDGQASRMVFIPKP